MIDLSPAQAAIRITALLAAHESRALDFPLITVLNQWLRGKFIIRSGVSGRINPLYGRSEAKKAPAGAFLHIKQASDPIRTGARSYEFSSDCL